MIKVYATKMAFYGNRRQYPVGHPKCEPFSVDKVDGTWMIPVKSKEVQVEDIKAPEEIHVVDEPSEDGEKSPSDQTDATNISDEEIKAPEEIQVTEGVLKRLKKDDLIAKATELGLSENINLCELTNPQIINLIMESQEAPNG